MPVLADTSVLNYLILLDQLALLPTLYGRVIIPTVVLTVELPHPDAPAPVRAWVAQLTVDPPWLERRTPTRQPEADLLLLEAGERDTILLAHNLLRVFRSAHTAHLGRGVGQEQWLRVRPSEKYAARCVSLWDEMRTRTACFARARQRYTKYLSKHFLLTFQEVTSLTKTRNQLIVKLLRWKRA